MKPSIAKAPNNKWAYIVVNSQFYEDTYSEEDVARLCQIGDLFPEDMAKFRKDLEDSAAIYRWESAKFANLPRSSEISRELKGLIKRINRFDEGLENLSEDAAHAVRIKVDDNNFNDTPLFINRTVPDDYPTLSFELPDSARPCVAFSLNLPEIRDVLRGLERATQDAIVSLPKRQSGPLRDFGLRLWMYNMKSLWERVSDNPFTRDLTDAGDAISPAARFCVASFHHISPNYTETSILWEMRDCIRESK